MRIRPRPEALAAAERYALGLRVPASGADGTSVMSRAAGASVEFHDHRDYLPGDELRHIDWRAYARSDRLMIVRRRQETRPFLDLVLDCSASMAADPDKAALAVDLAALLRGAAERDGFAVRVYEAGNEVHRADPERLHNLGVELDGALPLTDTLSGLLLQLRAGAVCVVISDFLFPHDAGELVRSIAARSGSSALVQVLSADDLEPPEGSAWRLVDAESGALVDAVLDPSAVKRYRRRLAALTDGLRESCRRVGGRFAQLRADDSLDAQCRGVLTASGVLAVR